MYRGLARGRTWNALHKALYGGTGYSALEPRGEKHCSLRSDETHKLFKHALVECTLRLATVFIILGRINVNRHAYNASKGQ